MNITSNAYYEIPLEKEAEYAHAEVETCIEKGQCYCHVSMHTHHPEPCHICKAEVEREFIAWCIEDEAADQARENPAPAIDFEIGPFDLVYAEELAKLDAEWFSKKERKQI